MDLRQNRADISLGVLFVIRLCDPMVPTTQLLISEVGSIILSFH